MRRHDPAPYGTATPPHHAGRFSSAASSEAAWQAQREAQYNIADPVWVAQCNFYRTCHVFQIASQHANQEPTQKIAATEWPGLAQRFTASLQRLALQRIDLMRTLCITEMAVHLWATGKKQPPPARLLTLLDEATGREHALYLMCQLIERDLAAYRMRHPYIDQALEVRRLATLHGKKVTELKLPWDILSGKSDPSALLTILRSTPPAQWLDALRKPIARLYLYRDETMNIAIRNDCRRLKISAKKLARITGLAVSSCTSWISGFYQVPVWAAPLIQALGEAQTLADFSAWAHTNRHLYLRKKTPRRPLTVAEQQRVEEILTREGTFIRQYTHTQLAQHGMATLANINDIVQAVTEAISRAILRDVLQVKIRSWLIMVVRTKIVEQRRQRMGTDSFEFTRARNLTTLAERLGHFPTLQELVGAFGLTETAAREHLESYYIVMHGGATAPFDDIRQVETTE